MYGTRGDQYQGKLELGQRVYSILYGGRDGIITAIHGEQHPESIRQLGRGCVVMGGRASVDIAFEEYVTRGIPESIVRGVQWYISDVVEPAEVIKQAISTAQLAVAKADQKKKEEQERHAKEKTELPARFPYLIPGAGNGAKNIRIELKRAFASVKFSVTTARGTGSININWTDGPTEEEVEKITRKYQQGDFDGMTDCYNYNHSNVWPDVFGGSQYIFENRHESPELTLRVAQGMGFKLESGEYDIYGNLPGVDYETSRMIYREVRKTSI